MNENIIVKKFYYKNGFESNDLLVYNSFFQTLDNNKEYTLTIEPICDNCNVEIKKDNCSFFILTYLSIDNNEISIETDNLVIFLSNQKDLELISKNIDNKFLVTIK